MENSILRTGAPTPPQRAAIRALVDEVEQADGVSPFNENAYFVLAGQRPGVHWLAGVPGSPHLRGYAQVDAETHQAVLMVAPHHRREGIGTALLGAVRGIHKDAPLWAFGNLAPAQAFGAARDLTVERELLIMTRDLAEFPGHPEQPPADITIRPFQPSDLDALVEVNAEAFSDHPEQGDLGRGDFEDRMATDWFDPQGLLLAEDDDTGRLLGYHWTKIVTEDDGTRVGEVYAIAVHPDTAGRGVGRSLLSSGLAYLSGVGVRRVVLYVEASSARVVQMYRAAHFVEKSRDALYR